MIGRSSGHGAGRVSSLVDDRRPAFGSLARMERLCFTQLGCTTCHRSESQGRGPTLTGVYGKPVLLEDGRTIIADENYIRESILSPSAKVVSGFKPIMPVFQGLVNEEQLNELVAYVKSLNQPPAGAAGRLMASPGTHPQEPEGIAMATTADCTAERENYLNKEYGIQLVVAYHRPQAHCAAVSRFDHVSSFLWAAFLH